MREIKFRAKRIKDGRWVYGAYHKHLPYTPAPIRDKPVPEEDYEHCIIKDGFSDWNMPRGFEGFEVDPETVGQLTGLKDKNGKEIYESDRVYIDGGYYFVEWDESRLQWTAKNEGGHSTWLAVQPKHIEVVGNKYES